jgi:hypothetical protein
MVAALRSFSRKLPFSLPFNFYSREERELHARSSFAPVLGAKPVDRKSHSARNLIVAKT